MKYIPNGDQTTHKKTYTITDDNDNEIGLISGTLTEHGLLGLDVKIYRIEDQGKGLGFEAFSKIYSELSETCSIEIIKGSWESGLEFIDYEDTMSTNLKVFFDEIEKGKSYEEAAFSTPTGKWAKKLGHTKCNVITISKEGTVVDFYK